MKQKVISDKRRLLTGVVVGAVLIAVIVIDNYIYHPHMTLIWHMHRAAPIAIGVGIGLLSRLFGDYAQEQNFEDARGASVRQSSSLRSTEFIGPPSKIQQQGESTWHTATR